jgi:hypothetical protein
MESGTKKRLTAGLSPFSPVEPALGAFHVPVGIRPAAFCSLGKALAVHFDDEPPRQP